jgi:hypothetical protein
MGRNSHTNRKRWRSDKMPENWQMAIICPYGIMEIKCSVAIVEGCPS